MRSAGRKVRSYEHFRAPRDAKIDRTKSRRWAVRGSPVYLSYEKHGERSGLRSREAQCAMRQTNPTSQALSKRPSESRERRTPFDVRITKSHSMMTSGVRDARRAAIQRALDSPGRKRPSDVQRIKITATFVSKSRKKEHNCLKKDAL